MDGTGRRGEQRREGKVRTNGRRVRGEGRSSGSAAQTREETRRDGPQVREKESEGRCVRLFT